MTSPLNDAELYDERYFGGHAYDRDAKRAEAYRHESRQILERVPHGGNILDIGCGTGGFLLQFDDRWEKYGVEPSDYAADIATSRGIRVFKDFPPDEEYRDAMQGFFSVIVFRGTIQHIAKPLVYIEACRDMLKDGGLICFIATPDTGGIVYRLWQELPALDPPRNWHLFSAKILTNILQRMGFRNITVTHPYGKPYANPPRDFLRFVLRFFGIKKPFAFPHNMMEVWAWK